MAELSPVDVELLRHDLPNSLGIAVEAPIYSDRRGLIEYRAAGDRGKPTVVLLHGLGSSSAGYRAQLAGLSRDFHVVAWNAPGFGASSQIDAQDVSVDHYAEALEAFVRALRVERLAALVGSSWGSVIAVAFTKRYPQHVGGLVLSAPNAGKGRMTSEARDAELDAWLRTADISIPVSRAAIAEKLLAPGAPALVRALVERLRDAMTTGGWRQAIRSLFTIYTPDVIPAIKRPVVVLSGALDRVALYAESCRTPHRRSALGPVAQVRRLRSHSQARSTCQIQFNGSPDGRTRRSPCLDVETSQREVEMPVIYFERKDSLGHIVLANPPKNLIESNFSNALKQAVHEASESDIRALLVRAEGPNFSHGGDVLDFLEKDTNQFRTFIGECNQSFRAIEALQIPTVAAVRGMAFGGAFELALACDFIVAAEDAVFRCIEASVGTVPLAGAVQRLAERIGRARAARYAMLCEPMSGIVAGQLGVATFVASADDVEATALKFAEDLSTGPTRSYAAIRTLLKAWSGGGVPSADAPILDVTMGLHSSEDARRGRAARAEAIKKGLEPPKIVFSGR